MRRDERRRRAGVRTEKYYYGSDIDAALAEMRLQQYEYGVVAVPWDEIFKDTEKERKKFERSPADAVASNKSCLRISSGSKREIARMRAT